MCYMICTHLHFSLVVPTRGIKRKCGVFQVIRNHKPNILNQFYCEQIYEISFIFMSFLKADHILYFCLLTKLGSWSDLGLSVITNTVQPSS